MNKRNLIVVIVTFVLIIVMTLVAFFYITYKKDVYIRLPINNKTERWVYKLDKYSSLKYHDIEQTDSEYIFKFFAKEAGKSTIIFEKYVGSEVEPMEIRKYDVKVDKNKEISIDEHVVDSTFEIMQTKNSGVEFKWIYSIQDESIVKLVDINEKAETDEIIDGATIDVKYVFRALKKGKTTITFKYVSLDEKIIDETIVYTISIDKDMNINIVEKRINE